MTFIDELVFSRQAIRRIDTLSTERYGIPGIVMMENAARGCAESLRHMGIGRGTHFVLVCGPGNNGGDGFAIARHLHNLGCFPTIFHTHPRDRYRGDARTNLDTCSAMRLPLVDCSDDGISLQDIPHNGHRCFVDALLGTGATAAPRGVIATAINWINEAAQSRDAVVVAIDLPSGLDCDTGIPFDVDCCVRATRTMTMAGLKLGFVTPESARWTGDIELVDIGVPRELLEELGTPLQG